MEVNDIVIFRDRRNSIHRGLDKDAVGIVKRTYDLPAHPSRVDVQFEGIELEEGWPESEFVLVDPANRT